MCEKWIFDKKVMEQKNTVVEDNAMDVFMDGSIHAMGKQNIYSKNSGF